MSEIGRRKGYLTEKPLMMYLCQHCNIKCRVLASFTSQQSRFAQHHINENRLTKWKYFVGLGNCNCWMDELEMYEAHKKYPNDVLDTKLIFSSNKLFKLIQQMEEKTLSHEASNKETSCWRRAIIACGLGDVKAVDTVILGFNVERRCHSYSAALCCITVSNNVSSHFIVARAYLFSFFSVIL